jgi:hypothetical protein
MKRVPITFFVLLLSLLSFTLNAQYTADVCNVEFSTASPAAITLDQQVVINFDYETDDPNGVRIFLLPSENGVYPTEFGNSGSIAYTGSGSGSASFVQLDPGSGIIDEIEVRVTNEDQSEVYKRFYLPVDFHYGDVAVGNFTFNEPDRSTFLHGEDLVINFNYEVNYAGPVIVYVRPFTNGELTSGYVASGSPAFTGSGVGTSSFHFNAGENVWVDEIRVQITNDDQSILLDEFFVPVNYAWSSVKLTNIDVNFSYDAFPINGDFTEVDMDYETTVSGGIRIFPRPFTHGDLSPGYSASNSPVYPMSSGPASGSFTFENGNHVVDHIRILVTNADQSATILEYLLPYRLTYGNSLVNDIELCPQTPARMFHGDEVNIHFNGFNDEGEDVRIFSRPMTDGDLTPDYSASGSPLYGGGSFSGGTAYFTINSGDVIVDEIRFEVVRASTDEVLSEFFIPVHYEFGEPDVNSVATTTEWEGKMSDVQPNPASNIVRFQLELPQTQDVQVYLLNNLGQQVQVVFNGKVQGQQSQWIEFELMNGLTPGLYYVQVQGAEGVAVKRLVVE